MTKWIKDVCPAIIGFLGIVTIITLGADYLDNEDE